MELGFIGGSITSAVGTTHKIASQMDGRWRLSAGCFALNSEVNEETAKCWGIDPERLYTSWQEFLSAERGKLDAVVILTPTPSHAVIVIAALELNYPVICEKAMSVSSIEADAIRSAIASNSGFLAVTYNYSGYPMLREMRELIRTGRLGELNQIHVEMPQEGFLRLDKDGNKPIPQDWRLHDAEVPTLALDLGVHLHHAIDFLSGKKPIEVCAINNTFGHFHEVIDNTLCMARYTGNLDCQIWYGKTALGNTNGLRVRAYGTEGSAEWYQLNPEFIEMSDNRGHSTRLERSSVDVCLADELRYNRFKAGHPAGFIEAFANYYVDIANSLENFRNGRPQTSDWVAGADLAHEGLLMLEAMTRSAKSGKWIETKIDGT